MTISVLGLQPRYFIRPNNTDWRHNYLLEQAFLKKNAESRNLLSFTLRRSFSALYSMNAGHVFRALKGRLSISTSFSDRYLVPLFSSDKANEFDVIYSYGCYPLNSPKPVVWHTGPTYIDIHKSRGVPLERIDDEIHCKEKCAKMASIISLSSERALIDFDCQFPGYTEKLVVLPFVMPFITLLDEESIVSKHKRFPINILFVGREAKRKGLDLLIDAFVQLNTIVDIPIQLTVVSNFNDGSINLPSLSNIHWFKSLEQNEVYELMNNAHIFAMPSRRESYGLVYLEAMAAGAVCIAPSREPQISIMRNGDLGELCEVSAQGVYEAMHKLIVDHEYRINKAIKAMKEFDNEYSLKKVLNSYEITFEKAAGIS